MLNYELQMHAIGAIDSTSRRPALFSRTPSSASDRSFPLEDISKECIATSQLRLQRMNQSTQSSESSLLPDTRAMLRLESVACSA